MFGIWTAFFNRFLWRRRGMTVHIMTFIYLPRTGLKGSLQRWVVKSALRSRAVRTVMVFAESECRHYARLFPEVAHKFKPIPLGIKVAEDDLTDPSLAAEGYFFATGSSNRDYDFLYRVFDSTRHRLKIACPGLRSNSNIKALSSCRGRDMQRLMANCRAVVIPLKDKDVSSGQLVMLQAMHYGKPIIVSDNESVRSYVADGREAVILANDVDCWRRALDSLTDASPALYSSLAAASLASSSRFTYPAMGAAVASAITSTEQ